MKTAMHKLVTLCIAAAICAVATSVLAAVNNLESYHFRHDYSTGARVFMGGANCPADFIATSSGDVAVAGPNGPSNAMHVGECYGPLTINGTEVSATYLDENAWTLAMSFRPGNVEKGILFAIGRLNGGGNSGRLAITICSSSDPSKLYIQEFYRASSSTVPALGESVTLTGIGNVTNGFHTLVLAYDPAAKTITPYVDGTKKTVLTLSSKTVTARKIGNAFQYGSHSSITGIPSGYSRSYTNTDVAFYDLRFYLGAFDDYDAIAYAAHFPCTYPFRPSAYIEAGATNTVANANNLVTKGNYVDTGYTAQTGSEFVVDFQFLDKGTVQQRIFGLYDGTTKNNTDSPDGLLHALYVNGSTQFAFARHTTFVTGGSWIGMGVTLDQERRVFTLKNKDATDDGSIGTLYPYGDIASATVVTNARNHTKNAVRTTYLFADNKNDAPFNFGKARIYSFEADEDGTPALFLVPDMQNGEAGFRNIIDGSFHGDGNKDNNPERPLRFYNGVGCASDYKCEDSTLYAKLYATSDGNGTVSVSEGEAAASAEGWVPRGGTLALSAAASDSSQYEFGEWTGDTWAIADGFSKTNASIEVSTPYAVQLRATFKPTVDAQLTIAADGVDAVNWSIADWRSADDPSVAISAPVGKEVTVIAHKSVTLTLDANVSLSKFVVQADANCVVTFASGTGASFYAGEVVVSNGVLRQGAAAVFGTTPKVTVEDGGTFDINGLAPDRGTAFVIAGDGAGEWPWALTSSVNVDSDYKSIDIVSLADDATIGGNVQICIGVRSGATFDTSTQTMPLTLNGHTLTKTGTGTLWFRRPYSTNEGTIDVQEGSLRVSDWSNADVAYGESCVSNIALVVREGTTVVNELHFGKSHYTLYFKTLDIRGATMTSSYGAFGAWEALSGHGSIAKLAIPDGTPAMLDGDLAVSGELTASGALSFVRKTGVETNVTVAATGTLTASGAITVGAGVIFNIGANRPTGTLTVADDAMLVLRKANLDEDEIVVNASTQPQNIILYDVRGLLIQNPEVSYDADAGTVTVRAPAPVWTNADGTGSFSATANWSSGAVPGEGRSFRMSLDGDTTVTLASAYAFGNVQVEGTGSVGFGGAGSLTLAKVLLTNGVSFAACGRVTATGIDVPSGSTATLTTFDGVAAGGVTGVGTLVLAPGEAESVTISGLSSFTGEFTVTPVHSMTGTLTCAATSLKKFTLNGTTNVVFTLVKGTGGSFKANEVVVAGGVLKQGSASVLSTTPKLTVRDGGTFDINRLKIEDATKPYIAGAGAGDWPWAICSSSGSMVEGNYLADITLQDDATIGGPGQLKIGASSSFDNEIVLNGHKLTLAGTKSATFRNLNTDAGTIELAPGYIVTLNVWNNLNSNKSKYSGTTLIIRGGARVANQTNREIYATTVRLDGGTITAAGDDKKGFGPLSTLVGHGSIAKLFMSSGSVFKPDGADYLNVTETLSGKLKVDISNPALAGKVKIPLLKVPVALKDTADGAFDLTALPPGWQLQSKDDGTNVEYLIRNLGFSIFIR